MATKITSFILALAVVCVFNVTNSSAATGTVNSIAPAANAMGRSGGTGVVTVSSMNAWTASTKDSWITITSGAGASGNGTISYTVSYNATGMPRTGTITIGNKYFTVRQPATDFSDNLNSSNWSYPYINSIYAAGITQGIISNNFYSADTVTRDQMAAFIVRSMNGENFTYSSTPYFSDVPATAWSFKYVQKMKDLGISKNTGTFDPSGYVTREQMAAFIVRALIGENFTYSSTPYFSDVPASEWSFKYVQKMRELGLTTYSGAWYPSAIVTREQMAAFISKAFLNVMPSSLSVPSANSSFTASMIMGKTLEFTVPNSGSMTYKFNENGTFTGTGPTSGMMMGSSFTGKWMINADKTLTINNVQGMMPGYTEKYTLVGGGGVLPLMVNYMYSTGATGTNMMMTVQ